VAIITLYGRSAGEVDWQPVSRVAAFGAGESWLYRVEPKIETTYWSSDGWFISDPVTVRVRPHVGLRIVSRRRHTFAVGIEALNLPARTSARFQERRGERWVTIRQVRVPAEREVVFRVARAAGRVRVLVPPAQVPAGYVAGVSRTLRISR
jgi:hypothetical protein